MQASRPRPTGVTILVILNIIAGIVIIALSTLFITFLSFIIPSAIIGVIGTISIGFGVAYFALAAGLLTGKPWAWTAEMILAIIGLILSLFEFNIIALAINIIILYYLTRPNIKSYFGKQGASL